MTQTNSLERNTPESQGISSTAILGFIDEVEKNIAELHSFMLVRHGKVVAEGWWSPYAPQLPHMLFSLSKSFTSTAVGLAVSEGRLTVEDPVLAFFPEDAPAQVSKNLAAMKVKHLLSMSTGHAKDTTGRALAQKEGNWAKGFLALPVRYTPGTHFVYNTAATYMLSAIVQKLTGMTLLDYLKPRLFEPLGIENPTWETCPRGINTGGFGLNVRTEDIARFGQLYLQKGMWRGQQILPETWVKEATSFQVPNGNDPQNDWNQGYGYQFWRCRHNIYRGDGAFGQYCIVMPEQDAVLAITSGVKDMQAVLNVVWDCLLPAMKPETLPVDRTDQERLAARLKHLALVPQPGKPNSSTAVRVTKQKYQIERNRPKIKQMTFDFTGDCPVLVVGADAGEFPIAFGIGKWVEGRMPALDRGILPMKASGAWTDENTFTGIIRFYETPFYQTMIFRFEGDRLEVANSVNVSFGPEKLPTLVGKMIRN